MVTAMATWFTGLLVTTRMARSAALRPRKSQRSPVEVTSAASARVRVVGADMTATLRVVRVWKLLGIAGLVGVAATGYVLVRRRRAWRHYDADELRDRLQARLAEADGRTAA